MVSDRQCIYEGLGTPLADGLALEDVHGRETIFTPGFQAGVDPLRQTPGNARER